MNKKLFTAFYVLIVAFLFINLSCGGGGGSSPNGSNDKATLVSISVSPAYPSIEKSASLQFTATGTYSDKSARDITASATWKSSDLVTAPIGTAGVVTGSQAGTSVISAELDGIKGFTSLTINGLTGVPYMTGQPSFGAGSVSAGNSIDVYVPLTTNTSMVSVIVYDDNMNQLAAKLITGLTGNSSLTVPITIGSVVPHCTAKIELEMDGSTAGNYSKYLISSSSSTVYSIYQVSSSPTGSYSGQTAIPIPSLSVQNSASGGSLYYLETFGNGSGSNADTVLEVYEDPSESASVINDDKDTGDHYSELQLYLISGRTYYFRVRGFANDPLSAGPYSIRISNTGFGGSSNATSNDPDSYDIGTGDDTWENATELALGNVQDHSWSPSSDPLTSEADWFKFTAP